MELKFIRLITGEDIISQISTENGKVYTVYFPMRVGYVTGNSLKQAIMMYPWVNPLITDNDAFDLSYTNILTVSIPSQRMISLYEKCVEYYYSDEGANQDATEMSAEDFYSDIEADPESSANTSSILESFLEKKRKGMN